MCVLTCLTVKFIQNGTVIFSDTSYIGQNQNLCGSHVTPFLGAMVHANVKDLKDYMFCILDIMVLTFF